MDPFTLAAINPHKATMRRMVADAMAREDAARRIAAVAPDRLQSLLEEAQRRQAAHQELSSARGWPTLATAGLDSVYEDVCAGRL